MHIVNNQGRIFRRDTLLRVLVVAVMAAFLAACSTHKPQPVVSQPAAPKQRLFATPDEAVDALVVATRNDNKEELVHILGPRAEKLISSGDKIADEEGRRKFLDAYDKEHRLDYSDDIRAMLIVGEEEWPMPIPLVHSKGGWWFDSAIGSEEILNRRIGRNELNVVGVCRAYVEAQQEFAELAQKNGGRAEYAQRFRSQDGKHDGLYWAASEGEAESPFGLLVADATEEGYSDKAIGKRIPYHGYYFKILKRQGPHASGGAKNYVAHGRMMEGFALLAYPAHHGDSGVMSFIVNQNGIVYEKNLGPNTATIARAMAEFDPDNSWAIVR